MIQENYMKLINVHEVSLHTATPTPHILFRVAIPTPYTVQAAYALQRPRRVLAPLLQSPHT